MKYRNREYKWFQIIFENNKPLTVVLYKKNPFEAFNYSEESVTTYWDNELLTDKPIIK